MKQFTTNIGDDFGPVEEAIRDSFLPSLFQGVGEGSPGQGLTQISVKQSGMSLPDLKKTGSEKWTVSCVITGYLITELRVH